MALSGEAKKPAAAAKAKRPVTLKHLAAVLAEEHQMTKRAGEALLGDLVSTITKHLKRASEFVLPALESYKSENGQPDGRNPATGEAIKIKASKKVAFRAAKDLKMAV